MNARGPVILLGGAALSLLLWNSARAQTAKKVPVSRHVYYSNLPSWFSFTPEKTVDDWIARENQDAIDGHAWQLWAAITADSGQTLDGVRLPVWQTWFSGPQVFYDSPPTWEDSTEHPPPGYANTGTKVSDAVLLSVNRYNIEMRDFIRDKQYYKTETLYKENLALPAEPVSKRAIAEFPPQSIMLKPIYWAVSATEPTPMPYWAGIENSTAPQTPTWDTWTQCVLVDPKGTAKNDKPITCNGRTLPAGSYDVAPLSRFFYIKLSKEEVDGLKALKITTIPNAAPGKLALFVASHISTKENADWTWQTFWWNKDATYIPPAQRARVQAPWTNYISCTAYAMTTPPGQPVGFGNSRPTYCFNPYIEPADAGLMFRDSTDLGVFSSCITCHRAAAYPVPRQGYLKASGFLSPSDPSWFLSRLKTDFLWSIPFLAHAAPYSNGE